ncbi:MAG: hypothetical protein GF311_20910, partial [Candidatus Lokiarchaeota archaeon]|nr:hypothetical protein [Candidatus Lokiarchaeota archaeon]
MKYLIFYFSGTGNTKLKTSEIKKELENLNQSVEIVSIEAYGKLEEINLGDNILGFGFPVYKFSYPRIYHSLFGILKDTLSFPKNDRSIPYFLYNTYCRFSANRLYLIANEIDKLGLKLIASREFKCPSNGIASLKESENSEYHNVMYFENRIDLSIKKFSKRIINKAQLFLKKEFSLPYKGIITDSLKLYFVDKIEKAKYPRLEINNEKCVKCGVCAKNCPEENFILNKGKIEIKNELDCLHCLRCLHFCPEYAVSFGELTFGPQRYTKKIRNELFLEASKTPFDAAEPGSKKVRRKWALNNIRY